MSPGRRARIAAEKDRLAQSTDLATPFRVQLSADRSIVAETDLPARAVREGRQAKDFAQILLESCQFTNIRADVKFPRLGIELSFLATDQHRRRMGLRRLRRVLSEPNGTAAHGHAVEDTR